MVLDYTKIQTIYIVCGKTDLRRGIDGLASIIMNQYELDVYSDALFLFCGNRSDRFKALYWQGDGFILLYKRFENGKLQWPRKQEEVKELTQQQLRWLLEGLSIEQRKKILKAKTGFVS
ncbi:IS66 family insertion sequence element accessory protein TnpB [Vagococcus hydrophili]|uniref:IS66 family insertion sequence element accessory protein TnpB n=1 Tax=Vagococcus hydrophili TaxID=2714947 RepID=A0A6G8ASD6_9ENTE|nr:IS66 family insertion sequence element accessory protein TnpB [Vagococcus hydrophili]QIL47419.1 IS66 family insertion sequence element accessory protein TnpB [Vagococcus hydrophili]QIL47916.1 IS66 family insertion sequence element accessory protein TnpB [Vagococcus hydrophili]QIL48517.1 IS66 family insertion sequence element accessory protein TnpB [Vagococcus hydrophili]QIL48726.1 IS66 family insertion sequence element accessory protein TnpB [Vagococcus hydrophili]QIL48948.1 IS66 family ins